MNDIISLNRMKMLLPAALVILVSVGCTIKVQTGPSEWFLSLGATITPQPTYTSQPTYTLQPTYISQATYTPQATYMPQSTYTPRPPHTPRPTYTPLSSAAQNDNAGVYAFATIPILPTVTSEPTPVPTLSAACQNPLAQFTAPSPNARIRGTVPIVGTASTEDFLYYKVEYAPEQSYPRGPWGELYQSRTPVVNGTLMTWDTPTVQPGVYWLRLLVHQRDGNYPSPCELRLVVTR